MVDNKIVSMNEEICASQKILENINWYIKESEKGRIILYGNNDIESACEVLNEINNRLKKEGEGYILEKLKPHTMDTEQLKREYKNAVINALTKQKEIDKTFNYIGYDFDTITEEFDSICKN